MSEWYEIRVKGHLGAPLGRLVRRHDLTPGGDGTTVLRGPVADQAALHGLIASDARHGLAPDLGEPANQEGNIMSSRGRPRW